MKKDIFFEDDIQGFHQENKDAIDALYDVLDRLGQNNKLKGKEFDEYEKKLRAQMK